MNKDADMRRLLEGVLADDDEGELPTFTERLEAFARGELSAEEAEDLLAAADGDRELESAVQAYAPLGEDFHREVVRRQRARAPSVVRPVDPVAPPANTSWLGSFRSGWGIAALALAAVLTLVVMSTTQPLQTDDVASVEVPSTAALPPYLVEGPTGEQVMRSEGVASAGTPRYHAGSHLEMWLRPETQPQGDVQAAVFLVDEGRVAPLDFAQEERRGVFHLQWTVGEGGSLAPGTYQLVPVIGPAGDAPRSEWALDASAPEGWQVLPAVAFTVVADP